MIKKAISYIHKTHPKSKSIKIKIDGSGQVVVVTPKMTPKFVINLFVKKNKTWIEKALIQQKASKNFAVNNNEILIFGKKYKKIIKSDISILPGVKTIENNININLLKNTKANSEKAINRFLKNTATKYIIPRTHAIAKKMKISFGKITLREQKTRWGSCSSKGNLNFNWRLVHTPPKVIDYVIIHELAHRKHMDHSRSFWNLVEKFDPEHKKNRGWLKRRGLNLS
ncbi:MAG: SprT family zinc-dependent metalloprotease [Patescibacteria group bacterium]